MLRSLAENRRVPGSPYVISDDLVDYALESPGYFGANWEAVRTRAAEDRLDPAQWHEGTLAGIPPSSDQRGFRGLRGEQFLRLPELLRQAA